MGRSFSHEELENIEMSLVNATMLEWILGAIYSYIIFCVIRYFI